MDMYRKISLIVKGLLLSSLLMACSVKQVIPSEEMHVSFVTVHHSKIFIQLPATYQWSEGFTHQAAEARLQHVDMWHLLKQAIEQEMQRKGYEQVSQTAQADISISFVAALTSALDDYDIQQKYALVPGLVDNSVDHHRYEKGSLIFDVVDSKTGQLAWRTAGQALVAVLETMPLAERKIRVAIFVKKLLAFLPEK